MESSSSLDSESDTEEVHQQRWNLTESDLEDDDDVGMNQEDEEEIRYESNCFLCRT